MNIEHGPERQATSGKPVDLESCIMREEQGFLCESNTIMAQDTCLDTDQKICHFEARPNANLETVIIYAGKGCACLRTKCNTITVDGEVKETAQYSNYCICNFTSNFTLSQMIIPTPIGLNISSIKELLKHSDLQRILEETKEKGHETLLMIHHDVEGIKKVLKKGRTGWKP